jgi:hypothetical protein
MSIWHLAPGTLELRRRPTCPSSNETPPKVIQNPDPYFSGPEMHHVRVVALPRHSRHSGHHASEHLLHSACARKLRALFATLPQQVFEYLRRLDVAEYLFAGLFCRTQSSNGLLPCLSRLRSAQFHSRGQLWRHLFHESQ